MKKSSIKKSYRYRERLSKFRLETGFSMLEAVVVVGVLLALAVGGFFAYGPIAENAKKAKVKSAASEIHTAALVADIDGDPNTKPQDAIDNWNNSTDKIRVEILQPTSGVNTSGDLCVQATNVASPYINARSGACINVPSAPAQDTNGIPPATIPDFSKKASTWYRAPALSSGNGRWWGGISTSADGSKLAAVIQGGGYIYTSTDTGRTWVERTPAYADFKDVASSADGSKIFAGAKDSLWLSNDSGATWIKLDGTSQPGNGDWKNVEMSSDGTKLVAASNYYGHRLWSSIDGGVTWAYGLDSSGTAWESLAASGDGRTVIAGHLSGGTYISRNFGVTFQYIPTLGSTSWRSAAASSDGKTLYFGGDAGRWVSRDSGTTWTKLPADPDGGWYQPAISADGSKWAVGKANGYLYTSEDAGATWYKHLEPADGYHSSVAISADNSTVITATGMAYGEVWIGSFGSIPPMPDSPAPSTFNTVTWNQTYGITENWSRVASSTDGRKLVSGGSSYGPSNIWTSMDYGATWTKRKTSGEGTWNRFASSANGEKLAATQNGGPISTSTDSGVTWTQQTSSGSGAWSGISSSYTGSKLVAVQNGGGLYTSSDSGVTWTVQPGAGTGTWTSVASSADGTRIVASQYGTGFIYTSNDSGVNWTKQESATGGNWSSVAISADGTKMIAGQNLNNYGYVWVSTDSGVTWTKPPTAPNGSVLSVASSADGSKLAVGFASYVYTSKDGGANWTNGGNQGNGSFTGISTSADGSKLFAVGYRSYYTETLLWRGKY